MRLECRAAPFKQMSPRTKAADKAAGRAPGYSRSIGIFRLMRAAILAGDRQERPGLMAGVFS